MKNKIYREDGRAISVTIPENKKDSNKRTLQLTHEQIDRVISSLYMTSGEYAREFKTLCERFPDEEKETKIYWHNKSGEFYDLADGIKNSEFDV